MIIGRVKFLFIFIAVSLLAFFACGQSWADEGGPATQGEVVSEAASSEGFRQRLEELVTVKEEAEEEFAQDFDSSVRYMPSSGAKSQSGSLTLVDSAAEYSYELKAFGKLPLELGVGLEHIGINNSTVVKLPASLTSVVFGAAVTLPFFNLDKTYLRVGVRPSFYTDNWNIYSSAFRLPVHFLGIYKPNDKLTYILGVGVNPDFRDDVVPILGLIYKPNDKLTFNIVPPEPTISYALNKKIELFTEFGAAEDEYKVTKDDQTKLSLYYSEVFVGGGINYKVNKFIESSLSAGGVFNRSLKYKDNLGKVIIKNGFYTELSLRASF
jgi:hypothetical protein